MTFPIPFCLNFLEESTIHSETSSVFEPSQNQEQDQEDEESVTECCPDCNIHEIIGKPICEKDLGECPICYEQLNMINVTITRCGHAMHSSCIFTSLESADCCPMCRTQLMRSVPDDEDEDQEDQEEEDQEDEEDQEEEAQEDDQEVVSVEQLATKLQNMGYNMADVLTMFFGGNIKKQNSERYTEEFFEKIDERIDGILDGTIPLSSVDTRSYAEVVKTVNRRQEQQLVA